MRAVRNSVLNVTVLSGLWIAEAGASVTQGNRNQPSRPDEEYNQSTNLPCQSKKVAYVQLLVSQGILVGWYNLLVVGYSRGPEGVSCGGSTPRELTRWLETAANQLVLFLRIKRRHVCCRTAPPPCETTLTFFTCFVLLFRKELSWIHSDNSHPYIAFI